MISWTAIQWTVSYISYNNDEDQLVDDFCLIFNFSGFKATEWRNLNNWRVTVTISRTANTKTVSYISYDNDEHQRPDDFVYKFLTLVA